MTKINKITLFLINHEEYSKSEIESSLECLLDRVDLNMHIASHQESDSFEWEDNLLINKIDRKNDDFEKYMR